jgi:hypothetical protein
MQEARFTLHDGEDEGKTERLQEFLDLLTNKGFIMDWDGHDSGINLWLSVGVGDEMVLQEDGSFLIIRRKQ